jgi:hypothetical protein
METFHVFMTRKLDACLPPLCGHFAARHVVINITADKPWQTLFSFSVLFFMCA